MSTFPHGWVIHPMAAAAGAFMKSLVVPGLDPADHEAEARWARLFS